MAEATTPTEAPRRATKAEGFAYTSNPNKVRKFSQMGVAQGVAADLHKKHEEGKTNADIAREVANGTGRKVSEKDLSKAEASLGAGKTKVNENGQVEGPPEEDKDARENFERGKRDFDEIRDYQKFFDIRTDVDNGLKPDQLITKYGAGWNTEYNQIRARVADAVLSSDAAPLLPDEVLNERNIDTKRDLVQEFLLKDPKFRKTYEGKVANILDSLSQLDQAEKPAGLIEAEVAQQTAESTHSKNTEALFQRLTQDRIPLSENEKNEIKTYLDNGNQEEAAKRMLEISRQGGRFPHAELFDELEKLTPEAIKSLQSEFLGIPPAPEKGEDRFAGIRNQKQEEYASAIERRAQIMSDIKGSEVEQREYTSFKKGIELSIQQAIASGEPLKAAAQKLQAEQAKWNQTNRGKESTRLSQETEILRLLEDTMSQSVGEVMADRYEELDEVLKQESEENKKKAEEKGEKDVAEGVRLYGEDRDLNGILLDPEGRKRQPNTLALKDDMLRVLYDKDGMTRNKLRALSTMAPFATRDEHGNLVAFDWKNADLATLTKEQLELLQKVNAADNGNYEKRFLADYMSSRTFLDKHGWGNLSLKDHEYALLDQKLGPYIDTAIGQSEEAKAAIKDLEAKGVKPKSKAALWALLIALGVLGVGAKMVIG